MLKFDAHIGWLYTELPFEERFAAAANDGFKAIENPNLYAYPIQQLAEWLGDNNLELVQTASPGGDRNKGDRGLACRPERVSEFRDGIGKAIEYARALDCSIIHAMAGLKAPDADLDAYYVTYIDNLRFAGRACAEEGIKVMIEPISAFSVPGFFLDTPDMAIRAINDADDDNVYMLYDFYHAQCAQGNLVKFAAENLDRIAHIQIADAPDRNEPGTGEIDYGYVLSKLDEMGYKGWVGCEYKPLRDTASSLSWLDPSTGKFEF